MAGLLDMFGSSWDDPKTLPLLAAAAAMTQQRGMPGLLAGLQQYTGGLAAAKDKERAIALEALKSKLLQAQIGETEAQAAERKAHADGLARAAARQLAFQSDLGAQAARITAQQALAGGGGPSVTNATQIGQAKPIDWQALALRNPDQIDLITKLAGSRNLGLDKVARTIEGTMPGSNNPATLSFDDFGRPVGSPVAKAIEAKLMNLGGSEQAYNPFALTPGQMFAKTMTPGEVASNQVALGNLGVARGNLGLAQQRLNFDMSQPKGQYDAERGLMIDPRTGQASPVTQGGQPIGPKDKNLTDAQAKALLFGSRAQEADRLMGALSKSGIDRPALLSSATLNSPALGAAVNALPGFLGGPNANQQSVEQAQRDFLNAVLRRESGAVISEPEFSSAQRQYFPQVGDSPQVIQQKARNRALAVRGLLAEVPDSRRNSLSSGGASGSFDDPGTIRRYNPQTGRIE